MSLTKTLYEKDLYPEIEAAGETSFGRDCVELVSEKLAKGQIDRRAFMRCMAMLGALPVAAMSDRALAQVREIVVVNWGGDSTAAYAKAFGNSYEKDTGIKMAQDGTGPQPAKIKAMVQSGKVVWDLLDWDASKALVVDAEGLLEPIDYTIVDKNKIYPGWTYNAGAAFYIYSSIITFDSSKIKGEPASWVDFWDVAKFPGKRGLRKTPEAGLEACMMAAGRPIDKVYPIDFDIVRAKLKELRPNLITWNTGTQSQDLLRNGEVTMAMLWHTRSSTLHKESKGKLTWTWKQGLMNIDVWSVVKNNPAGREAAMKFIAYTQDPKRQVELLSILGNGPVNPAAAAMVPEDVKFFDPTQPAHRAVQAVLNPEWWNAPSGRGNLPNDTVAREIWLDAVSA